MESVDNQLIISGPVPEIEKTEFIGELRILGEVIPCAVLGTAPNDTRVLVQREIVGLLTGVKKGNLDRYLKPENLAPYLPDKFKGREFKDTVRRFRYKGKIAHAYEASLLVDICNMYLAARREGKLLESQKQLAAKAEIIISALAKTAIDALVDEATGYQYYRDKHALQKLLDKYVKDEYSKWTQQFPIEFYRLMFKLNGWNIQGGIPNKRPAIIGKWTNEYIYKQLAPGVLKRLRELNPPNDKGRRPRKFFQYLTEDTGVRALNEQIYQVIGIMKISANWRKFKENFARAFHESSPLEIFDDED